jgi:hypothetical protein
MTRQITNLWTSQDQRASCRATTHEADTAAQMTQSLDTWKL